MSRGLVRGRASYVARHRAVDSAAGSEGCDGGFALLESMISIALITVIMSALGVLFLTTLASSKHERVRAGAVQVATSALENLRSHDATSLVSGRNLASVTGQFTSAQATSAPVAGYLAGMTGAVDTNATTTPTIPTQTTQTVGATTYTINQYLGWCYRFQNADGSTDCVKNQSGTATKFLRAVVAVSWTLSDCTPATCIYVTSALISTASDPTFQMHQPLPLAPIAASPGNQSNTVGENVNLQLTVQNGTGVPTYTWAITGLPAGLTMSPTGLITGSPTTPNASAVAVTATVTDGFLRSDQTTFTWRVYPVLQVSTPGPQASLTTDAVSVAVSATGGNGPLHWSIATGTLPPGLNLNATTGVISGQPSTSGQYSFTVKVTDSDGRVVTTNPISWTVTYPPLAASNPGDQYGTVGTAHTLQLGASGGSGNYVWSDPTNSLAPTGLSITSAGKISGTLTASVRDVSVSIRVTDSSAGYTQTITFPWHIVAAPSIDSPGTQTMIAGAPNSVALNYSCPNGSCTITLAGAPSGQGLDTASNSNTSNATSSLTVGRGSGTVYVDGRVASGAVTGNAATYAPTVSIQDADGISTTPVAGSWTVTSQVQVTPSAAAPATVQIVAGTSLSGSVSASFGSGPYTYSISSGKPAWMSINATTGALSGAIPSGRAKYGPITVSVTDSSNATLTNTFSWYADDLGLRSIPDQSTRHSTSATNPRTAQLDLSAYAQGGSGSNTYTLVDGPSWVSINGATLTATAPMTATSHSVTVSVRDALGATVVRSFVWTIS